MNVTGFSRINDTAFFIVVYLGHTDSITMCSKCDAIAVESLTVEVIDSSSKFVWLWIWPVVPGLACAYAGRPVLFDGGLFPIKMLW